MSAQLSPLLLQRSHWYVKVIGCLPVQLPFETVSVCPCFGVPDTVGVPVRCGAERGIGWITAVGVEGADPLSPPDPEAVTRTGSVCPTWGVPEIVGGAVFVGAAAGGAVPAAAATSSVSAVRATPETTCLTARRRPL